MKSTYLDTSLFLSPSYQHVFFVNVINSKSGTLKYIRRYNAVGNSSFFHLRSFKQLIFTRILSLQLLSMDQISESQKLKWLTITAAPLPLFMTMVEPWGVQIDENRLMPLPRRIHPPSLGNFEKLPLELLWMVFGQLTCDDIETLQTCSTGGRMAVFAFPPYYNLVKHAPTLLAVLKRTGLARSFTITQIYDTFVSSSCVTCGRFGGYVFLLSFTRCCLHCAETNPKFLPILYDRASKGESDNRILDCLPQLHTVRRYEGRPNIIERSILLSRELVELEKPRNPELALLLARDSQQSVGETARYIQRCKALTPLPCFIPQSASLETGARCAGCVCRTHAYGFCRSKNSNKLLRGTEKAEFVADRNNFRPEGSRDQGPIMTFEEIQTEELRLHDSRHILSHFESCAAAQALLKLNWTRLQKRNEDVRAMDLQNFRRITTRKSE